MLKIGHINIKSLSNKRNELYNFNSGNNTHIFSINETWLKPNKELNFPNYSIVRKDRTDSVGGGVALLIKKTIPFEEISLDNFNTESIGIRITNGSTNMVIVSYYKQPQSEMNIDLIKSLERNFDNLIILGDLNLHHPRLHSSRMNQAGSDFFDYLDSEDSNLLITNNDSPTFLPPHLTMVLFSTLS
ncbi:AP-like endonuclease reverse transcriptase [Brachionus plicatilis]|uniref:AP-like endonuclease reverse transcriptase n=1 Tax=Brachionus plicatilis TaxID=10195 RepID=A0A3M7QL36_BRAPC|nr:AP-like endonuclease reverse transcriptase [Brachionus plicatilis]